MARKSHDDAFGASGSETIIGAGVKVQGDLNSEADITIDGELSGTVTTSGDLFIGINANIKANLHCTNVVVSGNLEGTITASGEASIRETGQVTGDITAGGLSISSGGIFIGRSLMEKPSNALDHQHDDDNAKPQSSTPPPPSSKH